MDAHRAVPRHDMCLLAVPVADDVASGHHESIARPLDLASPDAAPVWAVPRSLLS